MAWFLNLYECGRCGSRWDEEWSCMQDDRPYCGARHMSSRLWRRVHEVAR
jgi:hypothetical protein